MSSIAGAPADLVLLGGAVYTCDAARTWATAVAVAGGRVLDVGTDDAVRAHVGPATRVVELAGRMVLPAFHDSHLHPVAGGVELGQCNLNGLRSGEAVLATVRRYAAEHPQAAWIVGGGWDLPLFPASGPRREDLDLAVPDRPAYLVAADGHSAWANSAALRAAGLGAQTPDPRRGRIERDPATGEPAGTLREAAMDLVAGRAPAASLAERVVGLRRALELAARHGIVALQEAHAEAEILEAYDELERRGELDATVVVSLGIDVERWREEIARLLELRAARTGPRLRATAVKVFADGVIESGTAALLVPYRAHAGHVHGEPGGDCGALDLEPAELRRLLARLDREGFQIHVHAMGDRATRAALDALAAAARRNGRRDSRHHLTHLELVDPADIPRFRELGVAANFQPLWACADRYVTEMTEPLLGPERSRWLYPLGSFERSGAVVVGGSDWSVSALDPLQGIEVAVRRREPGSAEGTPWIPEERIDLAAAIAAYTIRGAWLAFRERETGSLEPGKRADLVVLDRNLFAIPAREISAARVLLTLDAGRERYRDPEFAADSIVGASEKGEMQ
jgi:predicted amidohydrolase YtcJ